MEFSWYVDDILNGVIKMNKKTHAGASIGSISIVDLAGIYGMK